MAPPAPAVSLRCRVSSEGETLLTVHRPTIRHFYFRLFVKPLNRARGEVLDPLAKGRVGSVPTANFSGLLVKEISKNWCFASALLFITCFNPLFKNLRKKIFAELVFRKIRLGPLLWWHSFEALVMTGRGCAEFGVLLPGSADPGRR